MLEKAQDALHTTDCFVGEVCTTIRQSGVMAAFEHVMQEDYSLYSQASGKFHLSHTPPLQIWTLWLGYSTGGSSQSMLDVKLD